MQSINALSLAPDALDWLAYSRHPRILHVFDPACNLINERKEVLSIVTPQIGNGPFNLVIENEICFSEHINLQSLISSSLNHLNLGDLNINTADAKLWSPRPDWGRLHTKRDDITKLLITNYKLRGLDMPFAHLPWRAVPGKNAQGYSTTTINHDLPITKYQFSNSLISALASADLLSSLTATQQLAGLGIGLTPSGDDFIMGAIYAVWIIHPLDVAKVLAEEIANIAAPLTTSLSAAWLKSAGKGEAGGLWHDLFNALISIDKVAVQESMDRLLDIGHTSGVDTLAGFLGTFIRWAELASSKIP